MTLSHTHIWAAIDALAAKFNVSPSGLAKMAGLDPTSFNRSKRVSGEEPPRARWPSTESLSKLLEATSVKFSDFALLAEGRLDQKGVPLIGFAQAGNDGYFDDQGYPLGQGWDEISFPSHPSNELSGMYALEISGDSMLPVYREGDRIIVDPHAQNFRRGDRVVVKTTSGEVLAKELRRITARAVELCSLNPAYDDRTIDREKVAWMARIVWASQ
jgi:phage repressor protein C with HTH and peptisase S24 domain